MKRTAGVAALAGVCAVLPTMATAQLQNDRPTFMDDRAFLDEWQRRCFKFFWEQTNPATGMTADRAPADGSKLVYAGEEPAGSIASVGFGLSSIAIAEERGWVESAAAEERVETTLRFLLDKAEHKEGFFYHFIDMTTGQRIWNCEVSSVDTALLLAGVLTVRQYYADHETIPELATAIYDRVNWPWMMSDGKTLSMGWTPEEGFITWRWDHFSEHLVLQMLGLGSNTHPLPEHTWHNWKRGPVYTNANTGERFMSFPPLFVHQFSHAWVDFRGKRDDYADYWTNSVFATRAHRDMFSSAELTERFPHYSNMLWGVTSSDSANGYTAWGGPDPSPHLDGTIVPCAAAGSIPFKPDECIAAVRHMYDVYGDKLWKTYGLADAFNPATGWVANDVIGIDVGITMLMIENERSGFVWRQFMANPEINRAMLTAGFRPLPADQETAVALFFDGDGPSYAFAEPNSTPGTDDENAATSGRTPSDTAEPASE
ncbi:MAG: glucoamylase family protein [Planctomycetota bacterium]